MKIRRKLQLAFGLYVLLALGGGLFAFFELRTITRRLAHVEGADDMSNGVLELRRLEKNYLLTPDARRLGEWREQVAALRERIDVLFREIVHEAGSATYSELLVGLADYERFIGLLDERLRLAAEQEARVAELGGRIEHELGPGALQAFLDLRALERDLVASRDAAGFSRFSEAYARGGLGSRPDLEAYRARVERLAGTYRSLAYLVDSLRERAREIHGFAESFSDQQRRQIDRILGSARVLLLLTLGLIAVAGAMISAKLSRSISEPLANLERITRKIAEGDFSETIPVRGTDEIASLEATFNQMEERLQETIRSLELAVSSLHEKQAQLVEAEKLASIGTLAAGVAHEINNPLAIINEKAGLIQDFLAVAGPFAGRERVLGLLEGIGRSIQRCRTVTHRLLGFARRMDVQPESLDLDETLREVLSFLHSELLFKDIRLETDLAVPARVWSDREQLQQVFLNIVKNAVDALDREGRIWVATGMRGEATAVVTIRDNGPGIPQEQLGRIFEPFFTTKGRGQGTGLGLAVSYGIMRRLGGRIRVESAVGVGTTFTIDVPVARPGAAEAGAAPGEGPVRGEAS